MHAGLVTQKLERKEVLEEDVQILGTGSNTPVTWSNMFQMAPVAKLGGGPSLKFQEEEGVMGDTGLKAYTKTPAKCPRPGNLAEESLSWVNVEDDSLGFKDLRAWDPLGDRN